MAWVKIPADHHSLFLAAVPKDPRVTTLKMFGGIAAKVNGQMFAGLFAKSFIVKLSDGDRDEAMQLDGAEPFDPMGNGRITSNTILMPEETFGDAAELRSWLRRALDYTLTLPVKAVTPKDTPVAKVPVKPPPARPAPARPAPAKPVPMKDLPTKAALTKAAPEKPPTKAAAAKGNCTGKGLSMQGGMCLPCDRDWYVAGGSCRECPAGFVTNSQRNGCKKRT